MLGRSSRGDTIVEVIVAFGVFSLVAVGTVTVMNRGVAAAQRSLEVTLVRQQIDSQAELLRFARSTDSQAWQDLKDNAITGAVPDIDIATCPTTLPSGSGAFILTSDATSPDVMDYVSLEPPSSVFQPPSVHSQFTIGETPVQSYGFWAVPVEVSVGSGTAAVAYDIYVNACWYTPGTDRAQWLRTIVRLHDNA